MRRVERYKDHPKAKKSCILTAFLVVDVIDGAGAA